MIKEHIFKLRYLSYIILLILIYIFSGHLFFGIKISCFLYVPLAVIIACFTYNERDEYTVTLINTFACALFLLKTGESSVYATIFMFVAHFCIIFLFSEKIVARFLNTVVAAVIVVMVTVGINFAYDCIAFGYSFGDAGYVFCNFYLYDLVLTLVSTPVLYFVIKYLNKALR